MSSGKTSYEFERMRNFIKDVCGIYLSDDKSYLVESKLSGLLAESGMHSFEELYRKIYSSSDQQMIDNMIDMLTTNETFWFRDKYPWQIMEDLLLPFYIDQLRSGKKSRIRIWSAACSSGQEPFSTAMCINNYLEMRNICDIKPEQFDILATDISGSIIQIAGMGRYDGISISRGLDDKYKYRYFKNSGGVWCLDDRIRSMVKFRKFNLQNDFGILGSFDVIFCRNALIYFSDCLKKEVIKKTAASVEQGGVLFIGSSELLTDYEDVYSMEQHGNGIYFKRKGCSVWI